MNPEQLWVTTMNPENRTQMCIRDRHCPDVRRLSGVILRVASHRSLLGRDLSEQDLLNIVRQGGASGGDGALARTISRRTHFRLSRAYLFTDLTVLGLSLTYIPSSRIAFSLVTVTLSSFLIDRIQTFRVGGAQTDP